MHLLAELVVDRIDNNPHSAPERSDLMVDKRSKGQCVLRIEIVVPA